MVDVSAAGIFEVVAVLGIINRTVVVVEVDIDDFVVIFPVGFLVVAATREHHGFGRELRMRWRANAFFRGDFRIVAVRCDYFSVGILRVYFAGGEAALVQVF